LSETEAIEEFCRSRISDHPAENEADGRRMLRSLADGVRVEGGAVRGLYIPKIFSEKAESILKEAGEKTERICEKVIRRYRESESFRKEFGFSPELEELACINPGYETLLPILRTDIFFNESTCEWKYCELNADGSSGMIEDRELNAEFRKTSLYRSLGMMGKIESYELFHSLAAQYLSVYAQTKKAHERPFVAIVDFLEYASSLDEFEEYRKCFEELGADAAVCDIRDLEFDGEKLTCRKNRKRTEKEHAVCRECGAEDQERYAGRKVDIIYRRAVTSDILSHPRESAALKAACRAGTVCLLGSFCTQAVHDKAFFPAVMSREGQACLTGEEIDFLKEHLPETIMPADAGTAMKNKDRWVLKPRSSYGSRNIFIGKDCTEEEWEHHLSEIPKEAYLLQEYIEPYTSWNIDYTEKDAQLRKYYNTTGIYLFGGKFSGIYSRASENRIISTSKGGFDLASCVLRK
jgi:glutathione synthase/RimK-type ligase-like ATP-grasp enzyme